jgi:phenylpyruvate tautomerase PptA (4-oxalocrotonate tautomerase family)
MPILDVEIVVGETESTSALSAAVADGAARVFGSSPGNTWVRLRELPRDRYAENGGGPDPTTRPVFVSVLKAELPAEPQLAEEVAALAREIAAACNRPVENVHVIYEPAAAGRVAFGGRLLRSPPAP